MKYTFHNHSTVLYHAVSSYQLLEVILHRLLFHKTEKAILILPDFITKKYPHYKKIVRKRFFDQVYLFPYLQIPHRKEHSIEQDVERIYRRTIPYRINSFSEIYIAGAHFYFSLYLLQNNIPFHFFEDAAGMLSRAGELYQALSKQFPLHADIALKHGLFHGENSLIQSVICLKKAQTVQFSSSKYVNFSVEDALQNLPPQRRKRLIHLFLRKPIQTRANAILLTQQFSNLGLMTVNEQCQLYQKLNEKLQGSTLIIKKHPDDSLDYSEIFPGADQIKAIFPSELLPYVFRKKPDTIYTFDSTGCENLRHHFIIKKLEREVDQNDA